MIFMNENRTVDKLAVKVEKVRDVAELLIVNP
jgi:hypothetical protein